MSRAGKGAAAVRANELPTPNPVAATQAVPGQTPKGRSLKFLQSEAFAPWSVRVPRLDAAVWRVMWDIQPGNGGVFFVSHGFIAKRLELPPTQRPNIVKAVGRLAQRGLLVLERRGCSRQQTASEYRIPRVLPSVPTDTRGSVDSAVELVSPVTHQ